MRPHPPDHQTSLFKDLLTGEGLTTRQNKEFKENIRRLNSHMSFASLCTTKLATVPGRGPYCYKVEGQMIRRLSTAEARQGQIPQFSQVYFHDPAEADAALRRHPGVADFTPWLTDQMMRMYNHVRMNNPYALSYKMLKDVVDRYAAQNSPVPELTLVFNNRPDLDHRRYNQPRAQQTSEIAIILEGPHASEHRSRGLAVNTRDLANGQDSWVYLKVTSCHADPLTYPLFFPMGVQGWIKGSDAWDRSIPKRYPPPRVVNRRRRGNRNQRLRFIDDEAIDEDAPPPPDQDENGSPENPVDRNTGRTKELTSYTLLNYYQWNTHYRPTTEHNFSAQHYGGRLFQQYCVDAFSKIEEERIDTYRTPNMQKKLRAESYAKLKKHLEVRAHRAGVDVLPGKPIVLPSSFVGGPRYMTQKYQDSMTICRETDSPDLFITMTANTKWREILEALEPGQTAADRPDLVCRVFKLKLDELLKDLIVRKIFGTVAGYAWTIEYQKRSLPHVHILLILKDKQDKPRIGAHVDRIISAEIPDEQQDKALYMAVKAHMIHGPCGDHNKQCACMLNPKCPGTCFRSYPRQECKETIADLDGYPEYRRRLPPSQHACTIENLGSFTFPINNSWVVPYNPYLLQKFDTHLNVEISTSIKSCKYIWKYCFKGGDKAELRLRYVNENGGVQTYADMDELKHWADTRYISSHEAMWRILEFPTNSLSHLVHRLSLHLPDEQTVVFNGENMHQVANSHPKDTTLTAYFDLCKGESAGYHGDDSREAKTILYHDIPKHFTWKTATCRWERRVKAVPDDAVMYWDKNKPVIGRMYDISPKELELYSLRLLLLARKGCTCFDDLKFIAAPEGSDDPGYHCTSFHAAAKELGLIIDEEEWHRCLNEANFHTTFGQMRFLFATILMNCDISDPQNLWDMHCLKLIPAQNRHSPVPYSQNNHLFLAYQEVDSIIQQNNPHLSLAQTFHIRPPVPDVPNPQAQEAPEAAPVDLEAMAAEAAAMREQLNPEQLAAYRAIMESVILGQAKCFFIDGPGGTGKSFLYKCIIRTLESTGDYVCTCASTGIAATLIDGCTVHKLFGVPMEVDYDSTSIFSATCKSAQILRGASCIIWDEAPASHRFILDLADRLMREVCGVDRPFGGKTIIAGGDWRQTLPVVPRGTSAQQVAACLRMSDLWPLFSANTFLLTRNMRASNPAFAEWLLDVGNGITGPTIDLIQPNLRIATSVNGLIQATFGHVLNGTTIDSIKRCVILSPTNKNTFILNEEILNKLEGRSIMRYSTDYPIVERCKSPMVVPEEFLHTLVPPGMPPYRLHLKINGIYMLLRNMCVKMGMCNGTRFILREIHGHVLLCETIHNDPAKAPFTFYLPRITTTPPEKYPFPFKRRQYPIRPAFGMTINKSQGGTFDMVGFDLTTPVFGHGQAYVAASRVRDFDKITVLPPDGETTMKNIVLQQVFDKEYIDKQIRERCQRPIVPDRMDGDYEHMPPENENVFNEEEWEEIHLDHVDNLQEYNPDDGVEDRMYPDSYMYSHDELVFEDDRIAADHIL